MKTKEWTAGLSLTERCNERCKHCYIGRKNLWGKAKYVPVEISYDQVKEIIPKLKEAGVTRLNLGGGETPLHRDFISIVNELYSSGMKVSLTTNGSTFSKIKNYLHLFNDIGVSIDFSGEEHSEFRGSPFAFSRARETLSELVKRGVRNELVTCITSKNCNKLPEIYALAQEIGVDVWRLNRFHSSRNDILRLANVNKIDTTINTMNSDLSCTEQEMKQAYEYLAKISPKNPNYAIPDPIFRLLVGGKSVCEGTPYGKISFRIKSTGGVTPNVFTDHEAGNIFKENLTEILNRDIFKKFAQGTSSGKCRSCVNQKECRGGDNTDSYLLKNDISAPDPYCTIDATNKKTTELMPIEETRHIHETYLSSVYIGIKGMKK